MYFGFDGDYAVKYGVDCAIMIHNMQFWIVKNRSAEKHHYDGHYWTYNTAKAFTELFPFWSKRQIERILNQLVDMDVLIKGNYNELPYDRTCWYAFKDESEFLPEKDTQNAEMAVTDRVSPNHQTVTPIPDNIPDTNDCFINKTITTVANQKSEMDKATLEAKRFAKLLALEVQKVTKRKMNTSGWYRPILSMFKVDNVTLDRALEVMTWHFNNLDRKYCHTILSAQAFRDKFPKLEAMMKRNEGWY